jgi:hypothetical protein
MSRTATLILGLMPVFCVTLTAAAQTRQDYQPHHTYEQPNNVYLRGGDPDLEERKAAMREAYRQRYNLPDDSEPVEPRPGQDEDYNVMPNYRWDPNVTLNADTSKIAPYRQRQEALYNELNAEGPSPGSFNRENYVSGVPYDSDSFFTGGSNITSATSIAARVRAVTKNPGGPPSS